MVEPVESRTRKLAFQRLCDHPEALQDLVASLREAGFNVGVSQHIVVQELLLALGARGEFPSDAESLMRLLRPILTSSPSEQADFPAVFESWLLGWSKPKPPPNPRPPKPSRQQRSFLTQLHDLAMVRATWIALIVTAFAISLLVFTDPSLPNPPKPVFGSKTPRVSVANLEVISRNEPGEVLGSVLIEVIYRVSVVTAQGGRLDGRSTSTKFEVPVGSYLNVEVSVSLAGEPRSGDRITLYRDELRSELGGQHFIENYTLTDDDLVDESPKITFSDSIFGNIDPRPNPIWWGLALVAGTVLMVVLFIVWRRMTQAFLQRRSSFSEPSISRLDVTNGYAALYNPKRIAEAARIFRNHRRQSSNSLWVEATVKATVANGGLLDPKFGTRPMLPEYLVLIQQHARNDHAAGLVRVQLDALRTQELYLTCYSFSRDPRVCHSIDDPEQTVRLADLVSTHATHDLWIFADPSWFIDPMTGTLPRWTEHFEGWDAKTLFSFNHPSAWGAAEDLAKDLDFEVHYSSDRGLLAAARNSAERRNPEDQDDLVMAPRLTTENSYRWLSPDPPLETTIDNNVEALRSYLGKDGFRWLCACAMYPELVFDLTIFLGRQLELKNGTPLLNSITLQKLSILPWFREAVMPDWFRIRLLNDLTGSEARTVREAIQALLLSSLEGPVDGFQLEIADENRGVLSSLWSRLSGNGKGEGTGSPLKDRVFLSHMANRALSVRLPRAVGHFLRNIRRGPSQQLAPRSSFQAMVTSVAVGACVNFATSTFMSIASLAYWSILLLFPFLNTAANLSRRRKMSHLQATVESSLYFCAALISPTASGIQTNTSSISSAFGFAALAGSVTFLILSIVGSIAKRFPDLSHRVIGRVATKARNLLPDRLLERVLMKLYSRAVRPQAWYRVAIVNGFLLAFLQQFAVIAFWGFSYTLAHVLLLLLSLRLIVNRPKYAGMRILLDQLSAVGFLFLLGSFSSEVVYALEVVSRLSVASGETAVVVLLNTVVAFLLYRTKGRWLSDTGPQNIFVLAISGIDRYLPDRFWGWLKLDNDVKKSFSAESTVLRRSAWDSWFACCFIGVSVGMLLANLPVGWTLVHIVVLPALAFLLAAVEARRRSVVFIVQLSAFLLFVWFGVADFIGASADNWVEYWMRLFNDDVIQRLVLFFLSFILVSAASFLMFGRFGFKRVPTLFDRTWTSGLGSSIGRIVLTHKIAHRLVTKKSTLIRSFLDVIAYSATITSVLVLAMKGLFGDRPAENWFLGLCVYAVAFVLVEAKRIHGVSTLRVFFCYLLVFASIVVADSVSDFDSFSEFFEIVIILVVFLAPCLVVGLLLVKAIHGLQIRNHVVYRWVIVPLQFVAACLMPVQWLSWWLKLIRHLRRPSKSGVKTGLRT